MSDLNVQKTIRFTRNDDEKLTEFLQSTNKWDKEAAYIRWCVREMTQRQLAKGGSDQ